MIDVEKKIILAVESGSKITKMKLKVESCSIMSIIINHRSKNSVVSVEGEGKV